MLFRKIPFAVVCLGAAFTVSCAVAPSTTPKTEPSTNPKTEKVKLEFRRAETAPAAGLTPAMVPGWDAQFFLHPTADITEADVVEARVVTESREPDPVVELIFTNDGSKKMATLTEEHAGKRFAILLDGKMVHAPLVVSKIVTQQVLITGKFTKEEAERLVKSINAK